MGSGWESYQGIVALVALGELESPPALAAPATDGRTKAARRGRLPKALPGAPPLPRCMVPLAKRVFWAAFSAAWMDSRQAKILD